MTIEDQPIKWWQINNVIPIVSSAILIALSFASVKTDVAVIKSTQAQILANQEDMKRVWTNLENRVGENSLDIRELKTAYKINK